MLKIGIRVAWGLGAYEAKVTFSFFRKKFRFFPILILPISTNPHIHSFVLVSVYTLRPPLQISQRALPLNLTPLPVISRQSGPKFSSEGDHFKFSVKL